MGAVSLLSPLLLLWCRVIGGRAAAGVATDQPLFLRSAAESTPAMQVSAVQAMSARLLGGQAAQKFTFEIANSGSSGGGEKSWFELAPPAALGGVAHIRGSTGVELGAGLVRNDPFSREMDHCKDHGGVKKACAPSTLAALVSLLFMRTVVQRHPVPLERGGWGEGGGSATSARRGANGL